MQQKGLHLSESLILNNVCYSHNDTNILNHVKFTVESGQEFKICGENGVGKSTCLKVIAGLLEPHHGEILLPNKDGFDNLIAYIGHKMCLDDSLTPIEHFQLDLAIFRRSTVGDVFQVLSNWGISKSASSRPVVNLSAGQKKRLSVALLIAKRAKIWLIDEPDMNLDGHGQSLLDQAIRQHIQARGMVLKTQHHTDSGPHFELKN